jgi:rRNA-processing protein FCF1
LSNIIKEVIMDSSAAAASRNILEATLDKLGELIKEPSANKKEVIEELQTLKDECDKSIAHRVLAGSLGAYTMLVEVLELFKKVDEVSTEALSAILALMSGNPDLLDKRGIEIMVSYLDRAKNVEIQKKVLLWVKACCIMHEQNRQDIFQMKITERLKKLLDKKATPVIVRCVCGVMRALVLDDDVRVQYGMSHEHARQLATELLCTFLDFLKSKLVLF